MKSYIQLQLGKRIKELRKIKGLSQEIFAEQIGIATNTLSSIETGNAFMTAQTLEKILEILNITTKELFTFPENTSNEDLYSSILEKIEFIKNDNERLKIILNVLNGMV